MKKIILASTSPRRKEILEKVQIPFEVQPSTFEEDMTQNLSPQELAIQLSLGKAKNVASINTESIVIGADTFIFFEGKKLGKPKSQEVASEMLKAMRGKPHSVLTGYTVIDTDTNKTVSKVVETKIFFKNILDKDIEDYVNTGEPMDKAGAYALQGLGAIFIDKIEGDFFNVMGLPLSSLADTLREFGVNPFAIQNIS